jgi:hypothetical protein
MDKIDAEALEWASQHYGIPADDPRGAEVLRRSSGYAWKRLDLALRQLGRDVIAALPRPLRRLFDGEA